MELATLQGYGGVASQLGSAVSSIFQMKAAMDLAKAQRQWAEYNAQLEQRNAEAVAQLHLINAARANFDAGAQAEIGGIAVGDLERQKAAQLGTMRANAAAAGVEESGTVLDMLSRQAYESGREIAAAQFEVDRRTRAFLYAADDERNAATAALLKGNDAGAQIRMQGAADASAIRTRGYSYLGAGTKSLASGLGDLAKLTTRE